MIPSCWRSPPLQTSPDPAAPAPADPAVDDALSRLRRAGPHRRRSRRVDDGQCLARRAAAACLARQCLGLAFVALEQWPAAATVYEQAARDAETRAATPRRADFWVQAGNAWLAAGEAPRALQALDAALATTNLTDELRGEAHLDRARAQVALGHAAAARADSTARSQLVPADPFAWYLSAALARRESDLARARTDIARASQLAPDNPDILLLAGTLAGLAGNMAEAERLYRRVAAPRRDSEAGRQAPREPRHARARSQRCRRAPPATRRADAAASVEVEFDRRHDPHLLEGRIAAAARLPRSTSPSRAPIEK